jgi:predicted ATP-binding protein involved in virulence
LHPNWQKRIVSDLKNVFENVQFVATTHSPFIVQSLTANELINLDDVKGLDNDPNKYSVEEISENEMGVRNVKRSNEFSEMQKKAKLYFELIKSNASKSDIENAKKLLDEIRINYSNDPAYVALLESEFPKK